MKINIVFQTLHNITKIYANDDENKLLVNNKPSTHDVQKFVDDICIATCRWNEEYVDRNTLDGVEVFVHIENGNEMRDLHIKNKFPNNYGHFMSIIQEVIDGTTNN